MLGQYVTAEFQRRGLKFLAPTRQDLDLRHTERMLVYLQKHSFEYIIHLAAETDVDLCEKDITHANLINTIATMELAKFARDRNIPMIFISTSAVFGGLIKLRYCELDTPAPINYYGQSKWFAEQYVVRYCADSLIIRSSFMIGGGPGVDKKFISKLLPLLQKDQPVAVVADKIGSLTYAKDLAVFIADCYQKHIFGLVHFSSENSCSRYDVIRYIAAKIKSNSTISKADSQLFPLPAARSLSEALYSVSPYMQTSKSWEEIIDDYLKEWI